jgi:hypothetical protein
MNPSQMDLTTKEICTFDITALLFFCEHLEPTSDPLSFLFWFLKSLSEKSVSRSYQLHDTEQHARYTNTYPAITCFPTLTIFPCKLPSLHLKQTLSEWQVNWEGKAWPSWWEFEFSKLAQLPFCTHSIYTCKYSEREKHIKGLYILGGSFNPGMEDIVGVLGGSLLWNS